ncbi:MAG: hypothetical protein JSV16_08690 [Candidatus Hydrogenedentota bacterium]|nr:MAG: hypothetical protein JSV16_08690 [Candidatus Hydrogenedentota bacterium]
MSKRTLESRRSGPCRSHLRFFTNAALAIILVAVLNPPLFSDEIYFKSGYSRTAVVIRETEDTITFKTEMGMSTISRDRVDFVEKATQEENRLLFRKWRERELQIKEAREARRAARKRFEDAQKAKGLVKFEGNWMTPEEKGQILELRKRAHEHRRQFEAEQQAKGLVRFQHIWVTAEQAKKLREMEPEIYRLYDEIAAQRRTVGAVRRAMLNVTSLEEADQFSKRIEKINKTIAENTGKLGELLGKADDIEATSVRYNVPEEFLGALSPSTEID